MKGNKLRTLAVTAGILAVIGYVVIPRISNSYSLKPIDKPAAADRARLAVMFGRLPLQFEINQGQTDSSVEFLSRGPGYTLFLSPTEVAFVLSKSAKGAETSAVRMQLRGADLNSKMQGIDELPGKTNYFLGRDASSWRTNIATYSKVRTADVYSGIDSVYYGNNRQLEYDFEVAPGVDPSVIRLGFDGSDGVRIDKNGDLLVQTAGDEIRLLKPVAYQNAKESRREVAAEYVLLDDQNVAFKLGHYDREELLVIDPTVAYATYLGGGGTDPAGADVVDGIAVDGSGNMYVTGMTTSTTFPVVNPAYQGSLAGNQDVFVAKLNPSGSALIYSTYIGGTADDYGYGLVIDTNGNAYVAGQTASAGFPTMNPAKGSLSGALDAFLLKLNSSGSGLVYSTYLGGTGDEAAYAIALDSGDAAYVTGTTSSSTNFATVGAAQTTYGGNGDAFVAKLNADGASFAYVTYLGGSNDEDLVSIGLLTVSTAGIAVDSSGIAYVVGTTASSVNFPQTINHLQGYGGGTHDAFVTMVSAPGNAFTYSSYLGGPLDDIGTGVAFDGSGNIFVAGGTSGSFPTTNGALDTTYNGLYDAFVAKLNSSGSSLLFSTYLGGSGADFALGLTLDNTGAAYVVGLTQSTNFPRVNATQNSLAGGTFADAFVTKIASDGSALSFSTYFGGSQREFCRDIVVSNGDIYIAGLTVSADLPTVSPLQASYGGGNSDGVIARFTGLATATKKVRAQTIAQ
jgi:hypothetical protein